MSILCQTVPCTAPALLICPTCERRLCGSHYGAGSSSHCNRCFRALAADTEERRFRDLTADTKEARREAASQAASW